MSHSKIGVDVEINQEPMDYGYEQQVSVVYVLAYNLPSWKCKNYRWDIATRNSIN